MFDQLGLEGWTPATAAIALGLAIGLVFGILAQRSAFCLRRAIAGAPADRSAALGTWVIALAVAVIGTTALTTAELIDFSSHRFHASAVPVGAIILGGLLFGLGMVLARGCTSRLTILAGSGNLRAAIVLIIFAITAHATLKGVFAPARVWLSSFTVDLGTGVSLGALPGGGIVWATILAAALLALALRSSASIGNLALGGLIGALVPIAWFGTGVLLADEFDPITVESLNFTSSTSETLFWWIAGTAIAPGFGVGLIGGALIGSLMAATTTGEFKWTGFASSSSQISTGRYLLGGVLMGAGGVLAGGCTIGAGLSGVSTLSVSAILALLSIIAGARAAQSFGERSSFGVIETVTSKRTTNSTY